MCLQGEETMNVFAGGGDYECICKREDYECVCRGGDYECVFRRRRL